MYLAYRLMAAAVVATLGGIVLFFPFSFMSPYGFPWFMLWPIACGGVFGMLLFGNSILDYALRSEDPPSLFERMFFPELWGQHRTQKKRPGRSQGA